MWRTISPPLHRKSPVAEQATGLFCFVFLLDRSSARTQFKMTVLDIQQILPELVSVGLLSGISLVLLVAFIKKG